MWLYRPVKACSAASIASVSLRKVDDSGRSSIEKLQISSGDILDEYSVSCQLIGRGVSELPSCIQSVSSDAATVLFLILMKGIAGCSVVFRIVVLSSEASSTALLAGVII